MVFLSLSDLLDSGAHRGSRPLHLLDIYGSLSSLAALNPWALGLLVRHHISSKSGALVTCNFY